MIESHLNWNTHPTCEQVEGKLLLTEWYPREAPELTDLRHGLNFDAIDWTRLKRYAILSTDDSVCDWKFSDTEAVCVNHTGRINKSYFELWKVCPECTRPIKVITEPEVLAPLSIAGIPISITYNTPDNAVQWGFATRQDAEKAARSIESLLSDLATKMKGG